MQRICINWRCMEFTFRWVGKNPVCTIIFIHYIASLIVRVACECSRNSIVYGDCVCVFFIICFIFTFYFAAFEPFKSIFSVESNVRCPIGNFQWKSFKFANNCDIINKLTISIKRTETPIAFLSYLYVHLFVCVFVVLFRFLSVSSSHRMQNSDGLLDPNVQNATYKNPLSHRIATHCTLNCEIRSL